MMTTKQDTDERIRQLENAVIALRFRDRFFIDRLTITGDLFLIPADRRHEWHGFDVRAEQTAEAWPVPEWAQPISEMSHVEFECPREVM